MSKDMMYERIEKERKMLGIGQEDFASKYVHVSKSTYQHSKSECITPMVARELCELFGCSLDYLYCNDDCKQRAVNDVHEVTGLDEEAIQMLRIYKEGHGGIKDNILYHEAYAPIQVELNEQYLKLINDVIAKFPMEKMNYNIVDVSCLRYYEKNKEKVLSIGEKLISARDKIDNGEDTIDMKEYTAAWTFFQKCSQAEALVNAQRDFFEYKLSVEFVKIIKEFFDSIDELIYEKSVKGIVEEMGDYYEK